MTDITSVLESKLEGKGSLKLGSKGYSVDHINDFLREAHQINSRAHELLNYLRSIRQPYLSTAPPPRHRRLENASNERVYLTDSQRDQIDAEAKSILRDLNAAVGTLARAEQVRHETENMLVQERRRRNGAFGVLSHWAAGGGPSTKSVEEKAEEARASSIRVHREAVIWFLQRQLESCGVAQTSMMEIRLKRDRDRSELTLYDSRRADSRAPTWEDTGSKPVAKEFGNSMLSSEDVDTSGGQDSSPFDDEQAQIYARENQDMLKQFEKKIDQVKTAERSLIEISELQSTLATNLEMQSTHIDQLVQDSFLTTENVGTGNKELKKANERRSTAKMVFTGTVILCSTLIMWDLIF